MIPTVRQSRRNAARRLSLFLTGIAGIAFFGIGIAVLLPTDPFFPGVLVGAHVALGGLASIAAVLEWERGRLGEALGIATAAGATMLTLIEVAAGWWYFAPFLGVMALLTWFALVHRLMVRDEARHMPPAHVL